MAGWKLRGGDPALEGCRRKGVAGIPGARTTAGRKESPGGRPGQVACRHGARWLGRVTGPQRPRGVLRDNEPSIVPDSKRLCPVVFTQSTVCGGGCGNCSWAPHSGESRVVASPAASSPELALCGGAEGWTHFLPTPSLPFLMKVHKCQALDLGESATDEVSRGSLVPWGLPGWSWGVGEVL